MAIQKKKLFICLLSIGCIILLVLTAVWYAFCLKHVHLPDTLEIPAEVLQEAFTGKIQEYKGTRYISYYLPQDEVVKKFEKNGFKAVCSGVLASHKNGGIRKEDVQSGNEDYFVLADGAYMTNNNWDLRRDPNRKIFPCYWYWTQLFYQKNDVLIIVEISCNDPRKPELQLLFDEIAAYFNGYIEQQNALLAG